MYVEQGQRKRKKRSKLQKTKETKNQRWCCERQEKRDTREKYTKANAERTFF